MAVATGQKPLAGENNSQKLSEFSIKTIFIYKNIYY